MPLVLIPSPPTSQAALPEADSPPYSFSLPPSSPSAGEPSPPGYRFPQDKMDVYGGRPADEIDVGEVGRGLVKCSSCGKVIMEGALETHAENCAKAQKLEASLIAKRSLKAKGLGKRRNSEISEAPSESSTHLSQPTPKKIKTARPTLANSQASSSSLPPKELEGEGGGVRRFLAETGKFETKKQMMAREIAERKAEKAARKAEKLAGKKAKVDDDEEDGEGKGKKKGTKSGSKEFHLDRCCGVMITEGANQGQQCSRKLDCKIHAVGAKRDVPGRSIPFDECLRRMRIEMGLPVTAERDPVERSKGEKRKAKKRKTEEDGEEGEEEGEFEELVRAAKLIGEKVEELARGRILGVVLGKEVPVVEEKEEKKEKGKKEESNEGLNIKNVQIFQPPPPVPAPSNEEVFLQNPFALPPAPLAAVETNPTPRPASNASPPQPAALGLINNSQYHTFAGGATMGAFHLQRRYEASIYDGILGDISDSVKANQARRLNGNTGGMGLGPDGMQNGMNLNPQQIQAARNRLLNQAQQMAQVQAQAQAQVAQAQQMGMHVGMQMGGLQGYNGMPNGQVQQVGLSNPFAQPQAVNGW